MTTETLQPENNILNVHSDIAAHAKYPLSALLASVGDVEQVAELYFGCKLCSENVALYQGEDTFLEHIRECHAEYCTEPQPDEKPDTKEEEWEGEVIPSDSQATKPEGGEAQVILTSEDPEGAHAIEDLIRAEQNPVDKATNDASTEPLANPEATLELVQSETPAEQEDNARLDEESARLEEGMEDEEDTPVVRITLNTEPLSTTTTAEEPEEEEKGDPEETESAVKTEEEEDDDESSEGRRWRGERQTDSEEEQWREAGVSPAIRFLRKVRRQKRLAKLKRQQMNTDGPADNEDPWADDPDFPQDLKPDPDDSEFDQNSSQYMDTTCDSGQLTQNHSTQDNSQTSNLSTGDDDYKKDIKPPPKRIIYASSSGVRRGGRGRRRRTGGAGSGTGASRFQCQYCSVQCMSYAHLVEHENGHKGIRPYACPVCGKTFTRKANMQVHSRIHSGEKPFSCETCGKAFREKAQLQSHQRVHSTETPFPCEMCGKGFKDKATMKKHMLIHTGEMPFVCHLCGQAFRYKTDLNIHVLDHEGRNPLTCETCGKKFNKRHNYTKHLRVHTGEKNYVCSICNVRFREKSHLNRHVRLHSNYRPYQCQMGCDRSFPDLASLNAHTRTHTTAYKCSVCDKTFSQKHHANRHLLIHMNK